MNDCETCKHCKPDPEEPYLWVCEITGIALGIMIDCKFKETSMKSEVTRFSVTKYERDTDGNVVKQTIIEGTGNVPPTNEPDVKRADRVE
ncbi:hypothetical protein LCGC14_0475100 [marine sediment metagenome]|uniref:Uncharacterized protein n=1 Tax=marine sediment metagenome TaxID=412755 RepID=A0A0F9STS0_9ZZZZ